MVYGDAAGVIRLWNRGAEEIFGWKAEEAVGLSMDLIIPEKHRTLHWEGYARVMKTGLTKYGQTMLAVPALTKDGRRISIEFSVVLLTEPTGGWSVSPLFSRTLPNGGNATKRSGSG